MEELFHNEMKLIEFPIRSLIEKTLLNEFKTNRGREVTKLSVFNNLVIHVNIELSELRDTIIINRVDFNVRVIEKMNENASTNNNLSLRISSQINLSFNSETKEYIIVNGEEIIINDITYY